MMIKTHATKPDDSPAPAPPIPGERRPFAPARAEPMRRAPTALTPGERALVAAFVDRILADLGPARIERILLFGSRARGEGHADSDLDLAVFTAAAVPADAHRRLADLAQEVQDGHEDLPHLRPLLIRAGDPTNPALLRAITREGIALWAKKSD